MSPVPRLPSPVRYVVRAFACLALTLGTADAQDIGPISFRDSLVMRLVAFRNPCPVPAPKAWAALDSTLGTGLRCSLVEAAARAVEAQLQQRPALRERADPRRPLCVRVVVANNTGSTGLPGDWVVLFDLALDVPAYVLIDRQDGSIVLNIVGRMSGDIPSCITR